MVPGTFEFFAGGGEAFDPRVGRVEYVGVVGEGGIAYHSFVGSGEDGGS